MSVALRTLLSFSLITCNIAASSLPTFASSKTNDSEPAYVPTEQEIKLKEFMHLIKAAFHAKWANKTAEMAKPLALADSIFTGCQNKDRIMMAFCLASAYKAGGNEPKSRSTYKQVASDIERMPTSDWLPLAEYAAFTDLRISEAMLEESLVWLKMAGKDDDKTVADIKSKVGALNNLLNNPQKAVEQLREAECLDTPSEPLSFQAKRVKQDLVAASLANHNYKEAIKFCDQLIDNERKTGLKSSTLIDYISDRARAYEKLGQSKNAEATYQTWLAELKLRNLWLYSRLLAAYGDYLSQNGPRGITSDVRNQARDFADLALARGQTLSAFMNTEHILRRNEQTDRARRLRKLELEFRAIQEPMDPNFVDNFDKGPFPPIPKRTPASEIKLREEMTQNWSNLKACLKQYHYMLRLTKGDEKFPQVDRVAEQLEKIQNEL